MADNYLHGIEVIEGKNELRIIRTGPQNIVGVVGTAPSATEKLPAEMPTVFFKKADAAKAAYGGKGEEGTLPAALEGIFAQGNPIVVVIRAKSNSVTDIQKAVDLFLDAESMTGYKPKILCAPGFTGAGDPEGTPAPPIQPADDEAENREADLPVTPEPNRRRRNQ